MSSSEALVFGNRWIVKGTVGKGAFSEIFAAEDLTAEDGSELVAIKFHNANVDSSVMKWEGDVLVALAGVPCVPHLIHYGKENGRDYLVLELMSGEDMSALRDRTRLNVKSRLIPIEIASYLTRQMIQCLQLMHKKGFVHRDVKPSNFVRRSAEDTEFCIIDFGLAKRQHDEHGVMRAERENVEFRGTTIYASPYAHAGKDQCFRDDMFCVLHAFLDLVLGDLPWRTQSKAKDKAGVAASKTSLLEQPAQFLEDYIHWQEALLRTDPKHMADLRAAVEAISDSVCGIVAHLKTLRHCDRPNYALLNELLQKACPNFVSDRVIGSLEYSGHGFNWNDGQRIQDVMARFRHQAVMHAHAQSSAGAKSRRSSFDRDARDRLSIDHQNGNDVRPSAAGAGGNGASSSNKRPTTTSGNSGNGAHKPFMKVQAGQGSAGEYKLQTLHDKLAALRAETDTFKATQAAAQLSAMSSAGGASKVPTPNKPSATSSSSTSSKAVLPKLGLEVAVRWRNLTRELLKLPEATLSSAGAFETLTLCLQVLVNNEHFYTVNLGELDVNWSDFAEVQTTVAALYEFYAALKHNRSKALDDFLAEVGDSSPLDAVEAENPGNAAPTVTLQQEHTTQPHTSGEEQDRPLNSAAEAGPAARLTEEAPLASVSAPEEESAGEAGDNSSEASNASAPVSAAPSSADLAHLSSNQNDDKEVENESQVHHLQESKGEEEEGDGECGSPVKRARLG